MANLLDHKEIEGILSEIEIYQFSSCSFECLEYSLDLSDEYHIEKVVTVNVYYFSSSYEYKNRKVPEDSTGEFYFRVLLGDSNWSAINETYDFAVHINHELSFTHKYNKKKLKNHIVDEISSRMTKDFKDLTRALRRFNILSDALDSHSEPHSGPPIANSGLFLMRSRKFVSENNILFQKIRSEVRSAWATGNMSCTALKKEDTLLDLIEKNTEWFKELKLYHHHKDFGLKSMDVIPKNIEKNWVEVKKPIT